MDSWLVDTDLVACIGAPRQLFRDDSGLMNEHKRLHPSKFAQQSVKDSEDEAHGHMNQEEQGSDSFSRAHSDTKTFETRVESSKAVKEVDKEKYAESIEEIFSQGAEQIYVDFCKVISLQDFEHQHDYSHHNLDLCLIERCSVLIQPQSCANFLQANVVLQKLCMKCNSLTK